MRPFRILRYALVAAFFLGLATFAVISNKEKDSAVAFFVALLLAALVAAITRRERLSLVIRLGLLAAVLDLLVTVGLSIERGWYDADCDPRFCGPSSSYVGSTVGLYAFIGALATILVVACLPLGHLRRGPSNE